MTAVIIRMLATPAILISLVWLYRANSRKNLGPGERDHNGKARISLLWPTAALCLSIAALGYPHVFANLLALANS